MEVGRDHFPLARPATAGAISCGQSTAALFAVPRDATIFTGAAHGESEDGGGVAVAVAVVLEFASVATCPNKY